MWERHLTGWEGLWMWVRVDGELMRSARSDKRGEGGRQGGTF